MADKSDGGVGCFEVVVIVLLVLLLTGYFNKSHAPQPAVETKTTVNGVAK